MSIICYRGSTVEKVGNRCLKTTSKMIVKILSHQLYHLLNFVF